MQIRGRTIGPSHPPYVIAEVSCNHAGSEAVAHALIDVAKHAGAEAVKFQFYTPEGMVGTCTFEEAYDPTFIKDGPWAGQTMWGLYDRSKMPWGWGPRLKLKCHQEGLAFIASAYETEGLKWLMENCQPDALKVASFEALDIDFVEAMSHTGLPLIVSTGMASATELGSFQTYNWQSDPILLGCVSAYPAPPEGALDSFRILRQLHFPFGFSDHTLGCAVACAAVAKGACVLEKHIQLHPLLQTADSHFSLTPDAFALYCSAVKDAWSACQTPVGDVEASSRQFRRAPGGKRGNYGR